MAGITPQTFLADLFRPHVRDYESMNLVLLHLGMFCYNAVLETRFNETLRHHTTNEVFLSTFERTMALWLLPPFVKGKFRQSVRDLDWRALFDAAIAEQDQSVGYQGAMLMSRRPTKERWVIIAAAHVDRNNSKLSAFSVDLLRYPEPVASRQALYVRYRHVERDIAGEILDLFNGVLFHHWDQAFGTWNIHTLEQRQMTLDTF
ncbi:hypothetical protein N0V90_004615 [Kalmusia sp. IMI 367209]|nr:hypothetical protein N0V90_004615 [Kalmusia sp. IMI 367209]